MCKLRGNGAVQVLRLDKNLKLEPLGTAVKSICQVWSLFLAMIFRPEDCASLWGRGFGVASSRSIRPTVVAPK